MVRSPMACPLAYRGTIMGNSTPTGNHGLGAISGAAIAINQCSMMTRSRSVFLIGTLNALGAGVEKDQGRAVEWLQWAANKSLPQARYDLGMQHEHAGGVRPQARTAMASYR